MGKQVNKNGAEFVKWMGPLLDALRKLGGSGTPKEVSDWIAEKLKISDSKKEEVLKSGASRFHNQVQWARQYLVWEGLVESSKRGVWALTINGYAAHLAEQDSRNIFKKWVSFHAAARHSGKELKNDQTIVQEVEDEVAVAEEYKEKLLRILKSLSPDGFERVCQRLLREHGFEKVTVTGGTRDQGIDGIGILQINPFVSFKVLFQCKKYDKTVARAQVGDFRNAMIGRADKGIIMTTGTFSSEAIREAEREGAPPIELVDGEKLVDMFEKVELGLKPKTTFDIDETFFAQFRPND